MQFSRTTAAPLLLCRQDQPINIVDGYKLKTRNIKNCVANTEI